MNQDDMCSYISVSFNLCIYVNIDFSLALVKLHIFSRALWSADGFDGSRNKIGFIILTYLNFVHLVIII